MNDTNEWVETESYNSGWLDGYDALVIELYEGLNQVMPEWLISLVGGKQALNEALKGETEFIPDRDNEIGYEYGYNELLAEIVEEYRKRKIEMPDFLQKIVGHPYREEWRNR